MRFKLGIIMTTLAIAAATVLPGHAESIQATYVAGGRVNIDGVGSAGSISNLSEGIGRGGYSFTPSFKPRRIKIIDSATLFIGYYVCQDGGGGVCGQDLNDTVPDVSEAGCVTGTGFITLSLNYRANASTAVFIDAFNSACSEVATTGTITLAD